jgi:large subunit ribosomal protein L21
VENFFFVNLYSLIKAKVKMLALVEISGNQFEVEKSRKLNVPLLGGDEGDIVEFSNILLFNEDGNLTIGAPYVPGIVSAKILGVKKDDKVLVFHKKRRKGYRKLNGHRQKYSQIEIIDVIKN